MKNEAILKKEEYNGYYAHRAANEVIDISYEALDDFKGASLMKEKMIADKEQYETK